MKHVEHFRVCNLKASCWLLILSLLVPLGTAPVSLQAATLFWDTNGTGSLGSGAATGTWGSSIFWTTDSTGANVGLPTLTATTTNADDLFFSAGTNGSTGVVTISGTQLAHSITFDDPAIITLSGGTAINLGNATAGSGLFFTGNAANVISTSIILNSEATAIAITNSTASLQTIGAITGSAAGLQTLTVGSSSTGGITLGGIIGNGGGGGTLGLTVNSSGTGITTLSALNTFTGGTTLNNGTLRLGHNAALGTGALTINGGTVDVTSTRTTTNNNAQNWHGDFAFGGSGTWNTGTGAVTMNANRTVTVNARTMTVGGNITGSGFSLTKEGAGTLALGSGTNTFASTTINAGTLSITADSALGAVPLTPTANIFLNGGTLSTTVAVNANRTITIGSGNGTYNLGNAAGVTTGRITGVGSLTITGVNSNNWGNTASDYSGGTILSGGIVRLAVNGDAAAGPFGTGTVNLAGGGIGTWGATRSIANNLILSANSTLHTGGGAGRNLTLNGTLTLSGGTNTLTVSDHTLFSNIVTLNGVIGDEDNDLGLNVNFTGGSATVAPTALRLNAANTYSGDTTITRTSDLTGQGLILGNALALQNSALDTSGNGTVTMASGITTPTLGGLKGSKDLATVITSGYSTVTTLTLNPGTGKTATYSGNITDGAAGMNLTKTGDGTQTLTGSNTYTGTTTVSGGTLELSNSGALADISAVNVTVSSAVFQISGITAGSETVGSLAGVSGSSVILGAKNLNVGGDTTSTTFAGVISGTGGSITKAGSGTLTLTGTNTYTGTTTVSGGSLQVGSNGSGRTGTGAVTVQTGSTILGTGVIQGTTFTADSGSTIRPGDSVADSSHGTLSFTPATASASTSSLQGSIILGISTPTITDATFGGNVLGTAGYDAWVDAISGAGSHDRLVFNNPGSGTGYNVNFLTTTGSLQVVGSDFTPAMGQAFNLLDWASLVNPNFTGFTFNSGYLTGNGDEGADLDLPNISSSGLAWDFSRFTTSGVIVVVPEPSRALLLMLGLAGLVMRRRRQ